MVVSQGDKLLVGLNVTEYWMLIGRERGVGYNRETKKIVLTQITTRRFSPAASYLDAGRRIKDSGRPVVTESRVNT